MNLHKLIMVAGATLAAGCATHNDALFLSKSETYEHSCISYKNGFPSHVGKVLAGLSDQLDANIVCTKDATLLDAETLKNYNLVILYTQGDITQQGVDDGGKPATATGQTALVDWVRNGGALLAYHATCDMYHSLPEEPPTPFIEMLGGEFHTHGQQFKGTLKVTDPSHPTMARVKNNWQVYDEWYVLRKYNTEEIHVLALLDPGDERAKQEKYDLPSYPVIWCRTYGKGRIYYNAMGHREDVWTNPDFQDTVVDAARWVTGHGRAQAASNYAAVVPKEK